ncbi:MAG TPA: PhzF family phenazine biosynthesis protein, partial [Candidatus Binatus sp.]|nr:PhzF family phenazine biosynthesis protein [Candidatus Binatus sp.]
SHGLSDNDMQRIARETNFSETTFINDDSQKNGGYDVRIFAPGQELPFAGHPTLGTAYVIRRDILKNRGDKVVLNLKVGQIPVAFERDKQGVETLWMTQKPPIFGQTFQPERVSKVLGLSIEDIDSRFPVQEVSTGVPFTIVPLKTLSGTKRIRVDRARFLDFVKDSESKVILVYCPETYKPENQLNVRVFVEYFGIHEDPATGSGNGCLAGYLVKHKYFGKDQIDIRVEQGYEIGRPSLLYLKAGPKDGSIQVQVGGRVQAVANGELL